MERTIRVTQDSQDKELGSFSVDIGTISDIREAFNCGARIKSAITVTYDDMPNDWNEDTYHVEESVAEIKAKIRAVDPKSRWA